MRADIAETSSGWSFFKHRLVIAAALGTTLGVKRRTFSLVGWILTASRQPPAASSCDRLPHLLSQPTHIHQPQPDPSVGIDPARPIRVLHVDRREAYAVALRVFHERGGMIKPHRLIVEKRRVERGWIMR